MTFYWWSHWFWITLLGIILFPISIVHTYPSQEISLEYNQNSKTLKTVTKLYQTTTTLTWVTSAPPNHKSLLSLTDEKTVLQNVTPEMQPEDDPAEEADEEQVEQDEQPVELAEEIDDEEDEVEEEDEENISEEFEFKRSAENYNKTVEDPVAVTSDNNGGSLTKVSGANEDDEEETHESGDDKLPTSTGSVKLKREDGVVNNYTNFSSEAKALSTNSNSDNFTAPHELTSKSTTSSSSSAPAAPRIDSPHTALEWFSAMAAQLPAAVTVNEDDADDSETVTAAHKAPFTLENVNKEEELRRAENEHRSRKSKVLSAEYKHINRFINFSTDSKNLLTRSASSAPNEFENDEGNISSEALAIQRTYFLDAGAISAICFTIFGVCCTVGTIGIVLYRRRYLNKPQALSEPDSSVYIDDNTMRDNSDEMYSLDNDSFLNSLEAMTIQNYWTDTVKHTKL